ncbi:peptidoglycan recognition protein family protein [Nocardiopsis suaedae]|uniref:Peptidoglycan recognition family protein n=1 Tax=Nocardiopsis suaedae TaxID=3018444 RepID=A0ABT4TN77_9ACTN|nr:peptidoglycan recognition family protein [Nocardiopsis suaedae]MDA2806156.1 peptidoglycan recognition family protein [Nocardiopsis suaedae]
MGSHEQESPHPMGLTRRGAVRAGALAAGAVLLGGAADLAAPAPALAVAAPKVYTRSDWGARRPKRYATVTGAPDHIVVHHTATGNSTDYSKSHAAALSRAIQRHHMDSNGWDDTGQQFTISRGGHIMEGRNRSLAAVRDGRHAIGAHTANHNSHTVGIENEGLYTSAAPTKALMAALADTCAWLCLAYGLDPAECIVGHRDYNATSCPGDRLYGMLPDLRKNVAARMRTARERMELLTLAELPEEHLPSYPAVPTGERAAPYYHGPALGERDAVRAADDGAADGPEEDLPGEGA